MLKKKERQEEPDPGQSRGRARGEAQAEVTSCQSKYASEGIVARGGTSSEHLSKKQGAVKEKEKLCTDHLSLGCPLSHQRDEARCAVMRLGMGKERFHRGKRYFPCLSSLFLNTGIKNSKFILIAIN